MTVPVESDVEAAIEAFERSGEEFAYCRDFVVYTALHLAEFDYDVDPIDLGER